MTPQSIIDLAEICFQKGIRHAVISPGSRNAPLTLAFARHQGIQTISIPDERSAAFIGLGMAQASKSPCVLICTSGSAAYNYAPAVAEAYFADTPLLILTADRPIEWIGQLDGQTIFQEGIFGKHVKESFTFPSNEGHNNALWHAHRLTNDAINTMTAQPQGPVHINIPLREPFYPSSDQVFKASDEIKIIRETHARSSKAPSAFKEAFKNYNKILLVSGQLEHDQELTDVLTQCCQKHSMPLVADVICNLHGVVDSIKHHDVFLRSPEAKEILAPDLIITFGKSVISKNLKLFLREHGAKAHWHIQSAGQAPDTFQSLTDVIKCEPRDFFAELANDWQCQPQEQYHDDWKTYDKRTKALLQDKLGEESNYQELLVVNKVLVGLPKYIILHLSNSMMVRYVNFLGLTDSSIHVACNRGTSGIDGSVSTAVGTAMSTEKEVVLMTGDMAFFYDRNAFWHNHLPNNLKIILLNNHGGGIFRLIKGPSQQPELEEYFETEQRLSAKYLAEEFGLGYFSCQDLQSLQKAIPEFMASSGRTSILEIETDTVENKALYDQILNYVVQNLN